MMCGDEIGMRVADLWVAQEEKESGNKKLLHSKRGLFPRPQKKGSAQSEAACERFRFLGRLMAVALRDGFQMPLPLCREFFAAVLGEELWLDALPQPDDGWSFDFLGAAARFAAHLRKLTAGQTQNDRREVWRKEADKEGWVGEYLESGSKTHSLSERLSFNAHLRQAREEFFAPITFDFGDDPECADSDRPLDIDCLEEFIERTARWRLKDGILPQINAFKQGVMDLCTSSAIWAFDSDELRVLFCGDDKIEWSKEDLLKHLQPQKPYTIDSKPIRMLIDELVEMSLEERSVFMDFVTACPRLPVGGLEAAAIRISKKTYKDAEKRLPMSHTCDNELHLPEYDNKEELHELVREAMGDSSGISEFFK